MAALSISASPLSSTSVGTRRSGLYGAILSASPKVDHGRCSNGNPYNRSAIATRRTKGESYWPIRNMVLLCPLLVLAGHSCLPCADYVHLSAPPAIHVFLTA